MPLSTLEEVTSFLLRPSRAQPEYAPTVILSSLYEGVAWSLPEKREIRISTFTFSPEDQDTKSFRSYRQRLQLTSEELLGTQIFSIVSHPVIFTPHPHRGYTIQTVYKDGTQRFAMPKAGQEWISYDLTTGHGSNSELWEHEFTPYELTKEEKYALHAILTLSHIPRWIVETYGNYKAFAEHACQMFEKHSPQWWKLVQGNFYEFYTPSLEMFVHTLSQLRDGKPLRSSSAVTIAEPLSELSLDERLAAIALMVAKN